MDSATSNASTQQWVSSPPAGGLESRQTRHFTQILLGRNLVGRFEDPLIDLLHQPGLQLEILGYGAVLVDNHMVAQVFIVYLSIQAYEKNTSFVKFNWDPYHVPFLIANLMVQQIFKGTPGIDLIPLLLGKLFQRKSKTYILVFIVYIALD